MTHNWLVERADGGIYLSTDGPGELPTFVTAKWLSHEEGIGGAGHRALFGEPLPAEVIGSDTEAAWPYAQVLHIKQNFLAPVLRGLYLRDQDDDAVSTGSPSDLVDLRDEAQRWAPLAVS